MCRYTTEFCEIVMSDQTVIHPGELLELTINRKDDEPYTPKYIIRP